MSIGRNPVLLGVLALALAHPSFGGSVKDREKDVAIRSEAKKKKSHPDEDINSAFESDTYPSDSGSDGFLVSFWAWVVAAPFDYRNDDPNYSMFPEEYREQEAGTAAPIFPSHEPGQATIPYVRIDYNRQFSEWDPDDFRLETGYKLAAFHGRVTRYTDAAGDRLDLGQYYGVMRYGGSRPDFLLGTFEFALGLGGVHHTGNVDEDTSFAFTIPLKYYPFDWLGVEFRPAWYKWQEITIGDYDLSVSAGYRYAQLRLGYRWLWDNGVVEEQSGPYAGLSASF
ncbi:MAG: hypothetical protein OES84_01485 [Kiritimatiellaceae bacterium]|nr:hypothetical protein [Kiritimatiellaceae bacterium]